MLAVVPLWVVAMVAGLCWARWAVGMLSGATVVAALLVRPMAMSQPLGWFQLVAFGVTPWLLAAQRRTHQRQVKQVQVDEAVKLSRLQEMLRGLRSLQQWLRETEAQIAQITDLYHVTKDTARAMRVEELFAFSLEIIPRLMDVKGVRLIDLSLSGETPVVLRAQRAPDGRLLPDHTNAILQAEQAILTRCAQQATATVADAAALGCGLPPGVTRLAWTGLWSEQKLIGVLMADDLAPEALNTLSIVAYQVALQLARVRLYQQVEAMAVTDNLTGLFVRRYFLGLASEELLRSKRHGIPCAFLMADLDFFKAKNDTYGHLVGDVVLREVSDLLRKNLRGVDLIARYGGEEFILLLIETTPEQAMPIADRLRQLVEVHPIRAYDELLSQTVSIGIACYPEDGEGLQELIDRADQALYAAKRAGRNQVTRWSKPNSHSKPHGSSLERV